MVAKLIPGNRLTLLKNGAAFFPALEAAIDSACARVQVETYIFSDDESGTRIADALIRAAQRGVDVHALIDGFGSRDTPREFFARMRAAGVKVVFFRSEPKRFDFRRRRLRRTHRKLALIDGRVGFVGGINIVGDLTESLSATRPRYDYCVQIEGPVLADVEIVLSRLWRAVTWWQRRRREMRAKRAQSIQREPRDISPEPRHPFAAIAPAGDVNAALVVRDNLRFRRAIEAEYIAAISAARESILIVNAYFLPGRRLRRALLAAARRGVRVTLLLQGVADHPMLQLAARALYDQLLRAGVAIHEYDVAMLHGKVAVIDDRWATVGSSNLDPFSLVLNREANLVAVDQRFAQQLRASVEAEMSENAHQLAIADWQQRGWWPRLQSWGAYQLARLMAGLIGRARD